MNANIENTKGNATDNNVLELTIDDGFKKIVVKNMFGKEIGTWFFMPSDVGIVDRFNDHIDEINDIFSPLQDANISAQGEGEDDDSWATVVHAKNEFFAWCDEVFRSNFSEAFFTEVHPFSPIGGEFYAVKALNLASQVLENEFGKELNKIDKNVTKYTQAYQKKAKQHQKDLPKKADAE